MDTFLLDMKITSLEKLFQQEFIVTLYETDSGKQPVLDYIKGLSIKAQIKAFYMLELLANYGNKLRAPQSKHLKDNLFEIRFKTDSTNERIFYCFY